MKERRRGVVPALWLAVLCGAPLAAPAKTTIYHWVDEAGRAHYADHPGAPAAQPLASSGGWLSVVAPAGKARPAAANPFLAQELRWQREGRAGQQREAAGEIVAKERRCAQLRTQLAAAEAKRERKRQRALERQWYDGCR